MAAWMWFSLGLNLMVLEMFTGTFHLLMIGVGLAAGGVAAFAGGSLAVQLLTAAIVGSVATYGLQRSKWGKGSKDNAARDPNVNLDIGQTLVVDEWNGNIDGPKTARTMYRGALWDVELEPSARAESGMFVIREIKGSRLIVANSDLKTRKEG